MDIDYRKLNHEELQALGEKLFYDFMSVMDFANFEHIEIGTCAYGEKGEIVHVYNACFDLNMNLCYLHELQLLEPGKDPLSLASYFTDDMGSCIGPVLYRYPDGCFAGMDFYDAREADFSVRNPMKSAWFSNDREPINANNFDLNFYSTLSDVGWNDIMFLPHFVEMEHQANDFLSLLRTGQDETLLISFREDISSWPDLKLVILEDVIREKAEGMYPQSFLDSTIERYVNGYVFGKDVEQLKGHIFHKIEGFLDCHNIDMSLKETFEISSQNMRIDTYGKFSYKERGCYEISDTLKYVETFRNSIKQGAYFLTSNSYGDFRIGPDVSFYPDGSIASLLEHAIAGFETDVISEMHFNADGRLCHPSEMQQEFRKQWNQVKQGMSEHHDVGIARRGASARDIYQSSRGELRKVENNDKHILKR